MNNGSSIKNDQGQKNLRKISFFGYLKFYVSIDFPSYTEYEKRRRMARRT